MTALTKRVDEGRYRVHACNPNTQNGEAERLQVEDHLSYIYIAKACLKVYGREEYHLRDKMNITDYCTVIKCGLGKSG